MTTTWINGTGGLVLTESHAASAATFTLTPSSGQDYELSFFDGSSAIIPAAGISLTIPSGATMGALSGNIAFRLWFAVFNNGGTPVLGVRLCATVLSTTFSIISPVEFLVASSTSMSAASDNGHVFYTTAGVSSLPWMWVAFATYESGLATAGTWSASPTTISRVTPLTPRPGAILQVSEYESVISATVSVVASSYSNSFIAISLQSAAHFVEAGNGVSSIYLRTGAVSGEAGVYLVRNNPLTYTLCSSEFYQAASTDALTSVSLQGYDQPNTTSPTTYYIYESNVSGGRVDFKHQGTYAKEIMT